MFQQDNLCTQLSEEERVDTCTCNPGYSLDSADNSTCIDIDECATNTSSCDKNLGVCENVEGSYTCSCLNDFTVGPNGECEDRDGGFGEWSLFSNCTETCGEEGFRHVPAPVTAHLLKEKELSVKVKTQSLSLATESCYLLSNNLCEDQLEYGVQMELHGVTNTLFEVAEDVFTQKLATQINSYCISDSAAAQECCGVTFSLMSPENKTFLTYSDLEVSSRDIVDINGTVVVVTAEVDVTTNEVCTAISSGSRRKREISFVSQQLLLSILSDESFITEIVSVVETTLSHYNVTITNSPVFTSSKQVTLAPTTGSTTSDQATPTSTPSTANSTPAWVIAVSVVCGLLVVVAVAVAVVLLIKRPRKVSDGGNGHEVEANQNQANNHLTMPS
ncbi:ADAMTS14 [Bugula neritina]|uniref:ADAMTS14 n=1 Tax=Bugula neritina TaxID=10212 RepID=A0A7J7J5Y1_BUGNE|nr:ADAMTS14 [Bugula neritina]